MDEKIKQRLVGAAVVISLGVIFLPAVLDGGRYTEFSKIRIEIPSQPEIDFSSNIAPLAPPVTRKPETPVVGSGMEPEIDGIEAEGKASILDEELVELIKPIEAADKVVGRQGVDVRQLDKEKPKKEQKTAKIGKNADKISKNTVKKPLPVPHKGSSPVTAWVVQVGSFSSRESAIGLRDKLRKKGFSAFVESFERDGKPSHRVRIGPETTRIRSDQTLASLKKKMQLEGIVVTYP